MSVKIVIPTKNGLVLYTKDKFVEDDIQLVLDKDLIPSGEIDIVSNGEYDVTNYEKANVNIPIPEGYLKPEGNIEIHENGTYSVKEYETADVNVPIPEGYLKPEGTFDIDENGEYAVDIYSAVNVNVPIPEGYIKPEGKIVITSTNEVDVANYASAQIEDENLKADNIAEGITILGIEGTFKGGVDTSDATATGDDLLLGKIAYANEQKLVGTIEDYDYSTSDDVRTDFDIYLEGELSEVYNDRITKIAANRFDKHTEIIKVSFPNVIEVGASAFSECVNLESINFPKLEKNRCKFI